MGCDRDAGVFFAEDSQKSPFFMVICPQISTQRGLGDFPPTRPEAPWNGMEPIEELLQEALGTQFFSCLGLARL